MINFTIFAAEININYSMGKFIGAVNQKDVVIPNGYAFKNCKITSSGISFTDKKYNQFDKGIRNAKFGEFDATAVVDRSKEDKAPYTVTKLTNGFAVKIGTLVNVRLTRNLVVSIPTR